MKKFCILLIFLCYQSYASSLNNQHLASDSFLLKKIVNVNSDSKNLRQALQYLSTNHSISFVYVEEKIPWEKKVDITVEREFLYKVLDDLFKNTSVTYFQLEDQIALSTRDLADSLDTDSSFSIKKNNSVIPGEKRFYKKIGFKALNPTNTKNLEKFYYIRLKKSLISGHAQYLKDSLSEDTLTVSKDTLKVIESGSVSNSFINPLLIRKHNLIFNISLANINWHSKRILINSIEEPPMNHYQKSSGWKIMLAYQRKLTPMILLNIGLGLDKYSKKGIYTSYKINNLYPALKIIEQQYYNHNFLYLSVSFGIKFLKEWNKIYLAGGTDLFGNFFGTTDMEYFPIYQTQYFTRVLPMAAENEKFTDYNSVPIVVQPVKLKKLLPGISFEIEAGWKMSHKISLFFATGLSNSFSIYSGAVTMEEKPGKQYIMTGLRYSL